MRWELAEFFRILGNMEKRAKKEDWDEWHTVEEVICSLLQDNQIISKRFDVGLHGFVFGLAACGLQHFGILKGSRTIICALRDVEREAKENMPMKHRDTDKITVYATGHRYFELPDGQEVDPLFRYYSKMGAMRLQHFGKIYGRPYPVSVARGAIAYYKGGKAQEDRYSHGKHQNWFNRVVHNLARRQKLTPDTYGGIAGVTGTQKSKAANRKRLGFEGMLRMLIPRFQQESKDHWEAMLKVAVKLQFPSATDASVKALMGRLKSDFSPPLPRGTVWEPRRKIKLVEPSFSGDRQDT